MGTQRVYATKNAGKNVERESPPQSPQVPISLFVEQVTNMEFRDAFQALT